MSINIKTTNIYHITGKMKKRPFITILLFIILTKTILATNQNYDILIWNNDTCFIYESPFASFIELTIKISELNDGWLSKYSESGLPGACVG